MRNYLENDTFSTPANNSGNQEPVSMKTNRNAIHFIDVFVDSQ